MVHAAGQSVLWAHSKDDHPEYALMRAIAKRKKYATEKLRKAKGGKKHV